MSYARAYYSGEEIYVEFTATAVADWIGDPSIPNGTQDFISFEDIKIDLVQLLGVTISTSELKLLSAELIEAIRALADDCEFVVDESDFDS